MSDYKTTYSEKNDWKNGKNGKTHMKKKGPAAGKNRMNKNKK